MNKFIGLALAGLTFLSAAAYTNVAVAQAGAAIEDVNTARLDQIVHSVSGPIVVEFFDPTDADPSGECAQQKAIFAAAADQYSGQVTFLRFDIRQNPDLANAGRLTVCPTHLFINNHFPDPTVVPNRTPYRHWGLLTGAQFEELISEFFGIAKP